jgi:hypothetical protein
VPARVQTSRESASTYAVCRQCVRKFSRRRRDSAHAPVVGKGRRVSARRNVPELEYLLDLEANGYTFVTYFVEPDLSADISAAIARIERCGSETP